MKYVYEHEQIDSIVGLSFKYYLCNVQQNPLHWHEEIEMIYCVKGSLKIETLKRKINMHSGDIVLINKNSVHQILGEDSENVVVILQINFDDIKKYISDEKEYFFHCNSILMPNSDYSKLKVLIEDLIRSLAEKREGYILEISAIRNYLVLELLSSFVCEENDIIEDETNEVTLGRLSRILEYIEKNYKGDISLSKIAEDQFLSTYYLSHYFHDKMGISFRQYLTYTRVYHAREMLINSNDRIIDIALNCGFSNSQSFSKAFKAEFGKAPGKYRRELLVNDNVLPNMSTTAGHSWSAISPSEVLEHIKDTQ